MAYRVRTTEQFAKQLSKLDKFASRIILKWIAKKLGGATIPRTPGKRLAGNYSRKWRYPVGTIESSVR